jgi:hypothetical protein
MKWIVSILLLAPALTGADGPSLFYSKSFPGSTPAYFQVSVDKTGQVLYAEEPDDADPVKFQLPERDVDEMFSLADKLDRFKRSIAGKAKVAFMGDKVLRYENGTEKTETKYNYTDDVSARDLTDWFERIGESARYRLDLDKTAKYDKLGVFKALSNVRDALEQKRLVAPEQYLPMLDRIAKNQSYMHAARERAAEIAESIRDPK